jgi:hypothetical protein
MLRGRCDCPIYRLCPHSEVGVSRRFLTAFRTNARAVDAPPPQQPTSSLAADRAAALAKDGFLALPRVIPMSEVAYIRDTLMALHENKAGFREGAQFDALGTDDEDQPARFPQILHPRIFAPGLRTTEFHRVTMEIARQVLGPRVRFKADISFLKPAIVGAATPWHQDEAFHDPRFDYQEISFWLALQPTDRVNGCMEFIPGSHTWPVLEHGRPNGDGRMHALECVAAFDRSKSVVCELPIGGCSIHTARTLHAAGPNASTAPRLAYALLYDLAPVPAAVPRSFPWQAGERTARLAREKDWRRRGGFLIHAWRQRTRLQLDGSRIVADLRRAATALRVLRS